MLELKYSNYTLEKHLEEICKVDSDYKILLSIWLLNKQNMSKGLSTVSNSFPGYSAHDFSHTMSIINNIQNFLGEDRIKNLGATDTFLILMSCLTHDIGMILSYQLIEKEWTKENFIANLDWFIKHGDKQLSEAATLLKQRRFKVKDDTNNYLWALEVKNAVILLTSEIFRGKHAKISSDYLSHKEGFWQVANSFYSEQLPTRFMDLLSKIAFLHGESFDKIFEMLHFQANGFKGDFIHPRFIACLIRLGDLLDFDSNRFNEFSIANLKELPETSQLHKDKHASVKHMLVSPISIEVDLDCQSEKVYRITRAWFDMLEKEVNLQSREWISVAPKNLTGLPPVISNNSIRIYFKGEMAKPEMLNLKFSISKHKMFSILQGGGIYQEPGFVFIREIVQNALDASKLQLWKDLKSGIYDSLLPNGSNYDEIKYPDAIPDAIYSQYPISLNIQWTDETKEELEFICEDKGTGISDSILLRMTNFVGESHKKDEHYDEFLKTIPFWLTPTAAFGIGLQSVFFVSNRFEVETKAEGEKAKKIIFRSAAEDNYCSVMDSICTRRGTKVVVKISKSKFPELFGTSFSMEVVDHVDSFSDCDNDKYILKIDEYIKKKIRLVEDFQLNYNVNGKENLFNEIAVFHKPNKFDTCEDDFYKIGYYYHWDILIFNIIENRYGSELKMYFANFKNDYRRDSPQLLLRGIEIRDVSLFYYLTNYMHFSWNLCNMSSDTLVNISRDNLLLTGYDWVTKKLLRELLPIFLRKLIHIFSNILTKKENSNNDSLKKQYFYFLVTAQMFHLDIERDDIMKLENYFIENNNITKGAKESVSGTDFLETENVFYISNYAKYSKGRTIEDYRNGIINSLPNSQNCVVLWGDNNFFDDYLQFTHLCTKVCVWNENFRIVQLDRTINIKSEQLIDDFKDLNKYLVSIAKIEKFEGTRKILYPLKRYKNIIVCNNRLEGFERFPNYTNCSIYSPFSREYTFKDLKEKLQSVSDKSQYVKDSIKDYVSNRMVSLIIKNSIIPNEISEQKIYGTYIKLIMDIVED